MVEDALQRQRYTFCRVIVFRRYLVDSLVVRKCLPQRVLLETCLAEISCTEQRLQKRVHVTCRALILQSDIASLFLRVVAEARGWMTNRTT